jgi:hypothetical protein
MDPDHPEAAPMLTKKKPARPPRVTLSEMRANAGTPQASAALDLVVSHQSPFPWLNTVTWLVPPAKPEDA